jgi:hypothetical protein
MRFLQVPVLPSAGAPLRGGANRDWKLIWDRLNGFYVRFGSVEKRLQSQGMSASHSHQDAWSSAKSSKAKMAFGGKAY